MMEENHVKNKNRIIFEFGNMDVIGESNLSGELQMKSDCCRLRRECDIEEV